MRAGNALNSACASVLVHMIVLPRAKLSLAPTVQSLCAGRQRHRCLARSPETARISGRPSKSPARPRHTGFRSLSPLADGPRRGRSRADGPATHLSGSPGRSSATFGDGPDAPGLAAVERVVERAPWNSQCSLCFPRICRGTSVQAVRSGQCSGLLLIRGFRVGAPGAPPALNCRNCSGRARCHGSAWNDTVRRFDSLSAHGARPPHTHSDRPRFSGCATVGTAAGP